jgi:MFS family permease
MRTFFTDAAVAGFAGYAVLGLFSAVAPAFLGQYLGVTSPAAVGLVVFSVFAASAAGQLMLAVTGQEVALPAGCAGLALGMGLLALSLALSSLTLLIFAAVVAGLGHGLSFRAGLAGLNERAPAGQRAQVASSFFVVCYFAISAPVIGEGVLTQLAGLRTAGFVFAAAVAALALAALVLLTRTSGAPSSLPRPVIHRTLVPKENPQ